MVKKPVHPMLVHFPIALLVASFVADVAYFVCHIPHHTTNNNVEHKGGGGLTMILDVAG